MPVTMMERFWGKVKRLPGEDACWEWQGGLRVGYGVVGRSGYAHRFAYEHAVGPVPAGLCVCHRCDNRRCVRPSHLFLGTRADNQADMAQKLRSGQRRLTPEQVRQIRAQYAAGARQIDLAKQFGVGQTAISWVLRKGWVHVPHIVTLPQGVRHHRRRLPVR